MCAALLYVLTNYVKFRFTYQVSSGSYSGKYRYWSYTPILFIIKETFLILTTNTGKAAVFCNGLHKGKMFLTLGKVLLFIASIFGSRLAILDKTLD